MHNSLIVVTSLPDQPAIPPFMLPIDAALFNHVPLDLALNTAPLGPRAIASESRDAPRCPPPFPCRSLSKYIGVSIGSLDGKQEVDEHVLHAHRVEFPLKPFALLMDIGDTVLVTEKDSEKEGGVDLWHLLLL